MGAGRGADPRIFAPRLRAIFAALEERFPTAPGTPQTVYLAIVEKDSSVVYYVLKDGIVSPLEVPE